MVEIGQALRAELERSVFSHDPNWLCAGRDQRAGAHGLIQYPAMMVPAMQADILKALRVVDPSVKRVMDPFVGSGTALTESLALGYDFVGHDVNPLAILISSVKAGPFDIPVLRTAAHSVRDAIASDSRLSYEVHFTNQAKWFRKSNSIALSKIRRAVMALKDLASRRFFWVAMAETIRRCSNSRTSTYKLHIRPSDEITSLDGAVLRVFSDVVDKNLRLIAAEKERLENLSMLNGGLYKNTVDLTLHDARFNHAKSAATKVDLVITSPPYGDNKTTVPYGQFSYLALQWIPLSDIDVTLTSEVLESTSKIDSQSLGGVLRDSTRFVERLTDISPTFATTRRHFQQMSDAGDALKRWTAFCGDLSGAVDKVCTQVRSGGYFAWTIGERNLRGVNVPLANTLTDLHAHNGARLIGQFPRTIHTKRMPHRNDTTSLMRTEQVCVYQAA